MKTCSICQREDRKEIEAALSVEGASIRGVAKQFGVGRMALQRHQDHIVTDIVTPPHTVPTSSDNVTPAKDNVPHIVTVKPLIVTPNAATSAPPDTPFDFKKTFPLPGTREEILLRQRLNDIGQRTRDWVKDPYLTSLLPEIQVLREKARKIYGEAP